MLNKENIIKYFDKENNFLEYFNMEDGFYLRTGILEKQADGKYKDTGIDPFSREFPSLLDIGIMGRCIHGETGLCMKSGVQCYQNGLNIHKPNMSFEDYKLIIDQCKGKLFQVALGGRGDVDQHENFEDILKYTRENNIVPNFTTSGLGMTVEKAKICKKFAGAIAVSYYRSNYTFKAIELLLNEGVTTNIHYVLSKNSIDEAIDKIKNNSWPKGINAVIFLLHKPVGLGKKELMLDINDSKVKEFFDLIDNFKGDYQIGFDSCSIPFILNLTKNISQMSIDTCEGSRFSGYVDADLNFMPCSFDNEDLKWSESLKEKSIKEIWDGVKFNNFRDSLRNSCPSCDKRNECMGGCPIKREIVGCNSPYKDLK